MLPHTCSEVVAGRAEYLWLLRRMSASAFLVSRRSRVVVCFVEMLVVMLPLVVRREDLLA